MVDLVILFYLFNDASRALIFISLTNGRQTYGHGEIFLQRKPAVATQATLSDKQQVQHMQFPKNRTAHTTYFDGPVVDQWLECKIGQTANAYTMQDRAALQEDPNLYSWVLQHVSQIPLPNVVRYNNKYKSLTVNKSTVERKYLCPRRPALQYNASLHKKTIKLQSFKKVVKGVNNS